MRLDGNMICRYHNLAITLGLNSYVRQPHQTSDMLTNFKMNFFAYLKTLMTLASKCKNNYGATAKISKVMKDYVQKG